MTAAILAEFATERALVRAADAAAQAGRAPLDAFTPFRVAALDRAVPAPVGRLRLAMLCGGLAFAALAYGLEWFSAVLDYPLDSGGRQLHSWPAFVFMPFEVGVLGAALAGFVAFLAASRLPGLHHPLFEVPALARSSQDRFFLLLPWAGDDAQREADWQRLIDGGALSIQEVVT